MNDMDSSPEEGRLQALESEVGELRLALARAGGPLAGLVGKSAAMQELFASLLAWADCAFPVLVSGETGVGKRAAASALHFLARRGGRPLAFRSADERLDLDLATGGTLILEGIHRFPLEVQEQALRFAERSGTRLVCTSTREPEAAAREGKLLPDLRESSREMTVPALRTRKDDIPPLAAFFLEEIETQEKSGVGAIDPKALEAMHAHEWPGNVRELRNVIRRAHALSTGSWIGLTAIQSVLGGSSALPDGASEPAPGHEIVPVRVGDSMADIERRVLQRTLETIYNKVKEYGLERQFNRRFRKGPRSGEDPLRSGNR
jgi:DNA-binding NtrC family response regulator